MTPPGAGCYPGGMTTGNPVTVARDHFFASVEAVGWYRHFGYAWSDGTSESVCPIIDLGNMTDQTRVSGSEYGQVMDLLAPAAVELFRERVDCPDLPRLGANVASLNDHPDTTLEDWRRVYDRAAEMWEEDHR